MSFILLVFFTAFAMEAIGTYISVFGLSALFAGDPVILTMAVILDVAKVVSVSFIYQNWYHIKPVMKYYMLFAVMILMAITSAGAFGYLSGAFQKAVQPSLEISLKADSYKTERDSLTSERAQLISERSDMDKQVAQLPTNNVRGRRQLIYSFKPEQNRIRERVNVITKRLDSLNSQVLNVESENIDKQVHVGPIMYIAKAFNISVEEASKWIILTINSVFDPLAIILIVAGNFLVVRRKELSSSQAIASEVPKDLEEPAQPNPQPPKDLIVNQESLGEKFENVLYDDLWDQEDKDEQTPAKSHERLLSEEAPEKITENQQPEPTKPEKLLEDAWEEVIADWEYDDVVKLEDDLVVLTEEEKQLLSVVYDDIDTGEEPEDVHVGEFFDDKTLERAIKNYVPVNPVIEISGDMTYSGSPQAELIEEPMESSLESLKINMPDALLSNRVSHSTKKSLYS
jgi:hypothetical protein